MKTVEQAKREHEFWHQVCMKNTHLGGWSRYRQGRRELGSRGRNPIKGQGVGGRVRGEKIREFKIILLPARCSVLPA